MKKRMRQRKNNRHMSGEELLHKATGGWKFKTDNKMKDAYGLTDFNKKVVKVSKKQHKNKRARRYTAKPNGDEHLGKTILHELAHVAHPKAHEKTVEKAAKRAWPKLSPKLKKRAYARFA